MGKLVPILLGVFGLAAGVGAGVVLQPVATPESMQSDAPPESSADDGEHEYVELHNQFVIPVVADGQIASLAVLSLTLEVSPGVSTSVFAREPRIRAAFLQLLVDHANAGGFQGAFTEASNLAFLRAALKERANDELGPIVSDVLITEIGRQDI